MAEFLKNDGGLFFAPHSSYSIQNPSHLVLFLHGYGADCFDLLDLSKNFEHVVANACFLSVQAPFDCEMGYGYEWYSLEDRDPMKLLELSRKSESILNQFCEFHLKRLHLDFSKLILIGFSQGTMIALHTALRFKEEICCVIGFSGVLVGLDVLHKELKSKPKICLIHGVNDDVVPLSLGVITAKYLKENDFDYDFHKVEQLGHGISIESIKHSIDFLKKII